MTRVHGLREHRREFITDGERSELRATWHAEIGVCRHQPLAGPRVRRDLSPGASGGWAIGDIHHWRARRRSSVGNDAGGSSRDTHDTGLAAPLAAYLSRWRARVAWSLERIARKVRRI